MGASRLWSRWAAVGALLVVAACANDDSKAVDRAVPDTTTAVSTTEPPADPHDGDRSAVSTPATTTTVVDDSQTETEAPVEAEPCVGVLGALTAGQYTAEGTLSSMANCVGAAFDPPDDLGSDIARWHTFTLDLGAGVNVTLEADPGDTGESSTMLSLLEGSEGGELLLIADPGDEPGTATIGDIVLPPGQYTLEVRSDTAVDAGDYKLTINVPWSGLEADPVVTIDKDNLLTFDYWPPDAYIWLTSPEIDAQDFTSFLSLGMAARDGEATISLNPGLVVDIPLMLHITSEPQTTSTPNSYSVSYDVIHSYEFVINRSECGPGMTSSPHSGLCVAARSELRSSDSTADTDPATSPGDDSAEPVEPARGMGLRSAVDIAPFGAMEQFASLRVSDVGDIADLRIMPAPGDRIGPLFSPPEVDGHLAAAMGRVFDLCDDEEAQQASRVDPYGTGRRLPNGVMPADLFMGLQRDRLFMGCDGTEPEHPYLVYRYELFDAWGQRGGYQTAEDALERYRESRIAADARYAQSLWSGTTAWGTLMAGHELEYPDPDAPIDEVRVLTDSVAVRNGTLRGLVRNWSRRYFAYGTTVSAGEVAWHWPLSIQPGEVAPFEIENWTGSLQAGEIEFTIDAELSLDVDISRAWHISDYPTSESAGAEEASSRGYPDELVALLPQRGSFLLASVPAASEYADRWRPFVASSHPSLARLAGLVQISDLRGYVALLDDYGGRVMEVVPAWPLVAGWVPDSGTGERTRRHLEASRYPFTPNIDEFHRESSVVELVWYSPEPWVGAVWLGGAHPQDPS